MKLLQFNIIFVNVVRNVQDKTDLLNQMNWHHTKLQYAVVRQTGLE